MTAMEKKNQLLEQAFLAIVDASATLGLSGSVSAGLYGSGGADSAVSDAGTGVNVDTAISRPDVWNEGNEVDMKGIGQARGEGRRGRRSESVYGDDDDDDDDNNNGNDDDGGRLPA